MSVDLPAPFSPRKAWISPGKSVNEMWSFAKTPGNCLVILRTSKAGTTACVTHGSFDRWTNTKLHVQNSCEVSIEELDNADDTMILRGRNNAHSAGKQS